MTAEAIGHMAMPADFRHRSLFLHGRPRHEKYDDFWRRHPPMDTVRRARIFSSFDALAGFGDCIAGKEIQYSGRRHLCEDEKEKLDQKLALLRRLLCGGKAARKNQPQVTAEYFSPCADKDSSAYGTGGTFKTVTGICRKIDDLAGTITIGETVLSLGDITDISGVLFASL